MTQVAVSAVAAAASIQTTSATRPDVAIAVKLYLPDVAPVSHRLGTPHPVGVLVLRPAERATRGATLDRERQGTVHSCGLPTEALDGFPSVHSPALGVALTGWERS